MKLSFFFLLSLSFFTSLFSQDTVENYSDYSAQASDLLTAAIDQGSCVGIAAGFAVNGQIKWTDGKGYRDKKVKTSFQATTLSRIASISKPMTAVAIMQLYEQKLLDLDERIQSYLPEFPVKAKGQITVRQLLAHSSGIDAYQSGKERENRKHYANLDAAVDIFKDRELIATPGQAFNYTSYGYVVLGRIIETVSGMSYEEYLQKNIWDPAGMTNTGIEVSGKDYPGKAELYHRNNKGKIKAAAPTDLSDRIPGGGIYSTATDLLLFGNALLDHRLIKAETFAMMISDTGLKKEGNAYGLGWYLYGQNPRHGNVVGHTGGQTGSSAIFFLLPEQQTSIIVLSNTSGAMQAVSDIAVQLFDIAVKMKE